MRSIASLVKPAASIPVESLPIYIRAVESAIEELKGALLEYRKEYCIAKLEAAHEASLSKILAGA